MPIKLHFNIKYLVAVAILIFGVQRVSAGLFSSINYNQYVEASPFPFNGPTVYKYLTGTTLPVNQTLTIDNGGGQTTQAIYNFSDSGIIATLSIISSFNLTDLYEDGGEATSPSTSFEFDQPVNYSASFSDIIDGNLTGLAFVDLGSGVEPIFGSPNISNSSWQSQGMLNANTSYVLREEFLFNNGFAGASAVANGSDDLTLTFTPIPEPASLAILSAFPILLLKRRRSL